MSALRITIIILFVISCSNHRSSKKNADEETYIEGKFIRIEKINDKNYHLFIRVGDSVLRLATFMPLNEFEISQLKEEGNNIKITYKKSIYSPAGEADKYVTSMTPIYEPHD